jgi:competence protein ComEC
VFDAGFQLSFAAVVAIFAVVPRLQRTLEGYPLPKLVADAVAVSTACAAATAPIVWLQFHAVPLLAVPANVVAAPAVPVLLGLALACAALHPLAPGAAAAVAAVNGLCAAYLAACARAVGGLPFAQIRSPLALALVVAVVGGGWGYARRRWRSSSLRTS